MGIVNFAGGLVQAGARLLGIGGTAAGTVASGGFAGALRSAIIPTAGGIAGGAAGAGLFSSLFGGGAQQPTVPTGGVGSQMMRLNDGSQVLVSSSGKIARSQVFLPAGAKLPAGATVTFVSADATLFGIRKKRHRKRFATEIHNVLHTVNDAKALVAAVEKKKKN